MRVDLLERAPHPGQVPVRAVHLHRLVPRPLQPDHLLQKLLRVQEDDQEVFRGHQIQAGQEQLKIRQIACTYRPQL